MRRHKPHVIVVFLLQLLVLPRPSYAMTMLHYDMASLVFLSTDIVIANISESADHKFTATVTESLHGALKPADRLDTLTPFLSFFRPMQTGMRVVLFLDRRPRQYDFFNSEAAKSPFAVPPSGVYLIDEYDRVHEYYQQNNPGPYVAQHYSYFIKETVPTKEQDLALPSLAEVEAQITETVKSVDRVRPLLERTATREDFPALLRLIDSTAANEDVCGVRLSSAVQERVLQNIRSLKNAGLYLQALSVIGSYGPSGHATEFLFPGNGDNDKAFKDARVKYLLQTLGNKQSDPAQRIASAEILIALSKFRSGPHAGPAQVLPVDNEWLGKFAAEIQYIAKSIFDDASQDLRLRSLCVEFLDIDQADILADVRRVYSKTQSGHLRFAIEKSFLLRGDSLYASLNSPSGPVASRIIPLPESVCARKLHKSLGFLLEYQTRSDYPDRGAGFPPPPSHAVLTDLKSGRHFEVDKLNGLGGWYGMYEGQFNFELGSIAAIPAGDYSLFLQTTPSEGKPSLSTYSLKVTIRDSPSGKILSVLNSTKN